MTLVRRLQREIHGNPVKTAGLGVLLLVAAYFWAPLIAHLLGSSEHSTQTSSAPSPPKSATFSATPAIPAHPGARPAESPIYDWRNHARQMDDDARMNESVNLTVVRDPFHEDQLAAAAAVVEKSKKTAVIPSVSPAEVGLALGSTLVSNRKRIAEINGKSYAVNDQVRVIKPELDVSFRVVAIHPRRVVLERNGEQFELKIPRPLLDSIDASAGGEASTVADTADRVDPAEQRTGDVGKTAP